MLRAAIGFFIIGLLAFAVGAGGVGGVSMDIGKTLLFVFLALAVLSFLASMFTGRKPNLILVPMFLAGVLSLSAFSTARAEESTATKVENTAGDMKTDAKVNARKIRRHVRNQTGNSSVMKDMKDVGHDAGDKMDNAVDKAKRETK
jgi:uncharacterized membrane protein YtjA (UPF0391 family)